MKFKSIVIFALAVLVAGILLPVDSYAGGHRHGHWGGGYRGGHHHGGDSFHLGLGFVFPIYSYGYSYGYPYGYPYYGPPPVYPAPPDQLPPTTSSYDQPSYSVSEEEPAYCREYTKKIIVDGKEEKAYGTACLQDDGSWRIMN